MSLVARGGAALAVALALIAAIGCNYGVERRFTGEPGDEWTLPEGEILRIQTGEFFQGSSVSFDSVVTAVEYTTDEETFEPLGTTGLFVSDLVDVAGPYSGIYVALAGTEDVDQYAVGDHLSITGYYGEYYGDSEISATSIVELGGAAVPEPVLVDDPALVATEFVAGSGEWSPTSNHGPDSESYEGVLVVVEDVEVITQSLGHGMFAITGGLAIDKSLHYWQGSRAVGTRFSSITGVLVYNFDAFKLAPRSAGDFVVAP